MSQNPQVQHLESALALMRTFYAGAHGEYRPTTFDMNAIARVLEKTEALDLIGGFVLLSAALFAHLTRELGNHGVTVTPSDILEEVAKDAASQQ